LRSLFHVIFIMGGSMPVFRAAFTGLIIMLCAGARVSGAEYEVVQSPNPEYRPNTVFSAPEDLRSPLFQGLAARYGLDEVVRGESDEFRKLLLLRHWLNSRIVIDRTRPAANDEDALKILEEGPKGGRYSCGHFEAAQHAVLNAMGWVTRSVLSGPAGDRPDLTGSHGSNEVWCNSLCKWVMIDAEYDSHFEKDGVPLSALEISEAGRTGDASGVSRVQGLERTPVPAGKFDQWGLTSRAYAFVSWFWQTDRFSAGAKGVSPLEVVYDDDFFRNHTWYRGGQKHWAYDSGNFKRVADRGAIYWTPNVLAVKVRIQRERAMVKIESCTPNLKEYQMKREGGGWEAVADSFNLALSKPEETWILRSMNLAGVAGPEHRLVIREKKK